MRTLRASPSTSRRQPWLPRIMATLALVVVLAAPGAQASVPYRGPGHAGIVPLGDDGLGLVIPGTPGDNRTSVTLAGIPDSACRVVLDANATYATTHAEWNPGAPTARVWADAGTLEAPFRVVAHWIEDIRGACTAEVTEDGTIWHDPRGRPYRDPAVNATRMFLHAEVGQTVRVALTVNNNGTLPTRVTAALPLKQAGWEVVGGSPVLDVEVAPESVREFYFDVDIPRSQKPVTNVVVVELNDDHGWTERVTAFLELRRATDVPAADTGGEAPPEELPPWEQPTREAPAVPFGALAAVALAALLARRRAHSSSSG